MVALALLLERRWHVKAVVVSRVVTHAWIAGDSLEKLASSRGIPVVMQDALPQGERVDFVLSYMYRYRVKGDVLAMAGRGAFNFHPAPLPEFGGWAFYNVAILENAPSFGCTCHLMDEAFDTGPIYKVRRFPIEPSTETAVSLERRTQEEMIRLFLDFCDHAESGEPLTAVPQDASRFRYLTRTEFEAMKEIPVGADAETIDRYARAFWFPPYQCAYYRAGDVRIEVVPHCVKAELATLIHADDAERLRKAAEQYVLERTR